MESTLEEHGWTAVPRALPLLVARTTSQNTRPINVSQLEYPTTALAKMVLEYARMHLPLPTFNHSMRVFSYAKAIRQQHFPSWKFSKETLLLTALLHDLGTTPANISSTNLSFEFSGGFAALNLLKNLGAHISQAEAVCETIIRHQDLGDTGNITALTAIIHFATVFDNAGLHPELVHIDTIKSVVAAYPRLGWTGCFASVVREECRLKPWSNTTRIEGFAEMVEANKLMEPFD